MTKQLLILLILAASTVRAVDSPLSAPKKPASPTSPSKEALEASEIANKGIDAVDDALKSLERLGRKRRLDCQKSVGSEKFCGCLANKLPLAVDFITYVKILSLTKDELGYKDASAEDKKIIDLTIEAREICVKDGH